MAGRLMVINFTFANKANWGQNKGGRMYKVKLNKADKLVTWNGISGAALTVLLFKLMRDNGRKFKRMPKVGSCIAVMQGIDSTIFVEYN